MRAIRITAVRSIALLIALATVSPVLAQESHTVRIRDGVVSLDGRRVPDDQLPASLRESDHSLQLEFTGSARFNLGGVDYGVRDGRIVEVPPGEDGPVLYFSVDDGQFVMAPAPSGAARRFRVDGTVDHTIGTYLEVLDEQADQFEKIGAQLADRMGDETADVADRLREEARQTAIMVRAFPRVEVQTYLHGLQNRDRSLYDQLMREQQMEFASSQLAHRIFNTSDEATRKQLTEDLRKQLDEIFELKQRNRREEIAQLEQQLGELREQLAEREANREAIISRRLESLVGNNPHR